MMLATACSVALAQVPGPPSSGLLMPPPQAVRGPQAAPTPPELIEANRLYRRGELARALAIVEAFIVKNAGDPKARFLRALVLAEQQKTDEAIEALVSMTRDYPELPEPFNNLAVLYAGRGLYGKARDSLVAALQANPVDPIAQENLGDIYVRLAMQSYEQALSKNSDNRAAKGKLTLLRELSLNPERVRSNDRPAGVVVGRSTSMQDVNKPSQGEPR